MTSKLKPCPFCGSNDVEAVQDYGKGFVECYSCGTFGPDSRHGVTEQDKWNTRQDRPLQVGDVVHLKSGGPKMIVDSIDAGKCHCISVDLSFRVHESCLRRVD